MERPLILVLTLAAVSIGTTAAVTRPTVFRLGQEGTPRASRGIVYGGVYRSGRWLPRSGSGNWNRFQGRGPGGAK